MAIMIFKFTLTRYSFLSVLYSYYLTILSNVYSIFHFFKSTSDILKIQLILIVCFYEFLAKQWEQAESRCRMFGGHLFSFKEEKDIRVIKDLHNATHHHARGQLWTGLIFSSDSWSFTDDTDTNYAITKFREIEGWASRRTCVVLKNIGDPSPSPEPELCSSLHDFICQINANDDSTFSIRSVTCKFFDIFYLNLN